MLDKDKQVFLYEYLRINLTFYAYIRLDILNTALNLKRLYLNSIYSPVRWDRLCGLSFQPQGSPSEEEQQR